MLHFIKICCVCALFVISQLYAQNPTYIKFGISQDLPSSETHDIYQDSRGFIWIASDRGLVRFDGKDAKIYNQENGLDNDVIFSFFTFDFSSLLFFSNGKNELIAFNPLNPKPHFLSLPIQKTINRAFLDLPSQEYIRLIWKDQKGRYIISFLGSPCYLELSPEDKKYKYKCKLSESKMKKTYRLTDRDLLIELRSINGKLYPYTYYNSELIYHTDKIFLYDHRNDSLNYLNEGIYKSRYEGVSDLIHYKNQLIFILGKNLIQVGQGFYKCIELYSDGLKIIVHEDNFYIATNQGLEIYDANLNFIKRIFKNQNISSVHFDHRNRLWLTSIENGVYCIPNPNVYNLDQDCNSKMIFKGLDVDDQNIYGVDWNLNLWVINKKTLNTQDYEYVDCVDNFYISKKHSLKKYFGKRIPRKEIKSSFPYKMYVRKNVQSQDEIYLNTSKYIKRLCNNAWDWVTVKGVKQVHDVKRYDQNVALIATDKGLKKILNMDTIFNYKPDNPIFRSEFTEIKSIGEFFLLTMKSKGLMVLKRSGKYVVVDKNDGLASNSLSTIKVLPDSTIWVGSNKGLNKIKFDYNQMKPTQISLVDENSGLSANEVVSLGYYEDTLYVSTKGGLNYFNVNTEFKKTSLQKEYFHIDSIRINNEKVAYNDTIKSSEGQKVEFFMSHPHYYFNSDVKYQYRIINQEENWQDVGGNRLVLTNLSAGRYEIGLRSVLEGKVGGERHLFIVSQPFWYKTNLAFIIYGLLLIVLLYFTYRLTLLRFEKKKGAELERVKLELKALISQMNPHFTFNTVNSIQHYVLEKNKKNALKYLSDFASLMRQSLDFSRSELIRLEEEIEFLKLYIELENRRFKNEIELNIDLDLISESDAILFPALLLHPIIENSVIHGIQPLNEKGVISIKFKETLHKFEITLIDNGIGFSLRDRKNKKTKRISHGFEILKRRIKLYNGKNYKDSDIQVKSLDEGVSGTFVKIILDKEQMIKNFDVKSTYSHN